jgi:hypothetical protein
MHRTVAWTKEDPVGAEIALVELAADSMRASGVAIGSDPEPYRLDYELETNKGFATSRLLVRTRGEGWSRRLELTRRASRGWTADVSQEGRDLSLPGAGGDVSAFAEAVDPDLGLSPLFNTMPVLRNRIHEAGSANFLMVWVSVPDLSLHASAQRYAHLETRAADQRVIRFEAIGDDEDFEAELIFDADGLVIDYPGIARRIRAARRI